MVFRQLFGILTVFIINGNGNEFVERIFYINIFKCALQVSDVWRKTRPQHREFRTILFSMSVWVL